jgi:uroporphyrinogen decarboxylase
MPEYRAVRSHHSLLDICRTPEIAAEVTITAAERLRVDAAIIFADLLLPLTPMGLDFEFVADEGPRVHAPIRSADQARALRTDRTEDLLYVARAIEKVAAHFASPLSDGDQLGIIGFCGAPFTLASYMIEGGSSRNYIETKRLMYASDPTTSTHKYCHPERSGAESKDLRLGNLDHPDSDAWPILMEKLVTVLADYAAQQVAAGADVIQVFDSWVGALSVSDYRQYALAPATDLIARIRNLGVPVIYFGVDTASLLPAMSETGADVIGLDWRTPLDQAWRSLSHAVAVQGNLDPIALFARPMSSTPASQRSWPPPQAAPATSSTSATESSPTPQSKPSSRSSVRLKTPTPSPSLRSHCVPHRIELRRIAADQHEPARKR